jgi:alpha-L-rhamnosidase
LTWASTRYESIQGPIATSWKLKDGEMSLDVSIPANTTATIWVPAKNRESVTEGGQPAEKAGGLKFINQDRSFVSFAAGSGDYHFASEFAEP